MKTGSQLIASERKRQIKQWGNDHDDMEHPNGDLAEAAAVYALPHRVRSKTLIDRLLWKELWPWDDSDYRPDYSNTNDGRIKELVKAGAMIAAEIDRLLR